MTIGIIGLGLMGEGRAKNIQEVYPDADISILTKRIEWEAAGPCTTLVQDEDAFFEHRHDVYFITNETYKHADTLRRCLALRPRGIFVEKPLSHTREGLEALRAEVTAQGIVCVVGYSLQFFPPLIELQRIIRSGELGGLHSMHVSVGKDVRGTRSLPASAQYSHSAHTGGGAILDYIHELNYPGWLLGEEISFVAGGYGCTRLAIDAEDMAESIFQSKSGVLISIHQDYLQTPGKRSCEVRGPHGTVLFSRVLRPGSRENELRIDTKEGTRTLPIEAGGSDRYMAELQSFMAHVQAGDGFTNLDEAIRDLQNVEIFKEKGVRLAPASGKGGNVPQP